MTTSDRNGLTDLTPAPHVSSRESPVGEIVMNLFNDDDVDNEGR